MPDVLSTATLTVTQPGPDADAIMTALATFVVVEPTRSPTKFRLLFQHTPPTSVLGVTSTHLTTSGFREWRDIVDLEIDGLPRWLQQHDATRRR